MSDFEEKTTLAIGTNSVSPEINTGEAVSRLELPAKRRFTEVVAQ
jgi:hypothetical protein